MRKTLIAMLFAATLPAVAMAALPDNGPDKGPSPFGHGQMQRGDRGPDMFRGLDLTREQRQQVGKLMGEEMHQRHEITESFLKKLPAADQKAMQDQLKASHDKTEAGVRATLTPDQQKQFDDMKKKQEERRAEWAQFQAWKAQNGKKAQ